MPPCGCQALTENRSHRQAERVRGRVGERRRGGESERERAADAVAQFGIFKNRIRICVYACVCVYSLVFFLCNHIQNRRTHLPNSPVTIPSLKRTDLSQVLSAAPQHLTFSSVMNLPRQRERSGVVLTYAIIYIYINTYTI